MVPLLGRSAEVDDPTSQALSLEGQNKGWFLNMNFTLYMFLHPFYKPQDEAKHLSERAARCVE